MKNANKVKFLEIKKVLKNNQVDLTSILSDDDEFSSLNSISNAKISDLTFLSNISQLNLLKNSKAKACLINKKDLDYLSDSTVPIIVENPYKAFAIVSSLFKNVVFSNGNISKNSSIIKNTFIGKNVQIEPFVVIKENCTIGNNVIIESNCTIGPNVNLAENVIIKPNTSLLNCIIGTNSIINSGAIIGGDGFGFDPISKAKIHHFGNVVIKNNCNIGSGTTIDRAVFDSTVISDNSFIDNLVQIAHNVIIGKGAIIAAQSGIAGSTIIGENIMVGGQVGISGHLKIGNNVKIAAKSGVTKNLNDNSVVAGFPAIDIKKWKLKNIKLNKL